MWDKYKTKNVFLLRVFTHIFFAVLVLIMGLIFMYVVLQSCLLISSTKYLLR